MRHQSYQPKLMALLYRLFLWWDTFLSCFFGFHSAFLQLPGSCGHRCIRIVHSGRVPSSNSPLSVWNPGPEFRSRPQQLQRSSCRHPVWRQPSSCILCANGRADQPGCSCCPGPIRDQGEASFPKNGIAHIPSTHLPIPPSPTLFLTALSKVNCYLSTVCIIHSSNSGALQCQAAA